MNPETKQTPEALDESNNMKIVSGVNVIDLGGTDEFKNGLKDQTDTYRTQSEAPDTVRQLSPSPSMQA